MAPLRALSVPVSIQRAQASVAQSQSTHALPADCDPIDGYRGLGTSRRAIATCQVSATAGPWQLHSVGMAQRKYSVLIRDGEAETTAHTLEALRLSLAPIDDPGAALAMAAWTLPLWEIPTGPLELSRDAQFFKWRIVAERIPTPEVRRTGDGWRLRWPTLRTFGCEHALWFDTVQVATDGSVQVQNHERIQIARDDNPVCVD